MANRDTPHGFRFAYTLHGGPPRITFYKAKDVIYRGDLVLWGSTGIIPRTTGDTIDPAELVIGVANGYSSSGAAGQVPVYDDLVNTVFTVQCETSVLGDWGTSMATQRFSTTWAEGSHVTGMSAMELATDTTDGMVRMIGMVGTPDNTTDGPWQEVYVSFLGIVSAGLITAATTQ